MKGERRAVICISSELCVFGEDEGKGPHHLFMADREPSKAPGTDPRRIKY